MREFDFIFKQVEWDDQPDRGGSASAAGFAFQTRWSMHAVAASVTGLVVGSALFYSLPGGESTTSDLLNPHIETILPVDAALRGPNEIDLVEVAEAEDVVFVLVTSFDSVSPQANYRVEIFAEDGTRVSRREGLIRRSDGTLTFSIRRVLMPSGRYSMKLFQKGKDNELATYRIDLKTSTWKELAGR